MALTFDIDDIVWTKVDEHWVPAQVVSSEKTAILLNTSFSRVNSFIIASRKLVVSFKDFDLSSSSKFDLIRPTQKFLMNCASLCGQLAPCTELESHITRCRFGYCFDEDFFNFKKGDILCSIDGNDPLLVDNSLTIPEVIRNCMDSSHDNHSSIYIASCHLNTDHSYWCQQQAEIQDWASKSLPSHFPVRIELGSVRKKGNHWRMKWEHADLLGCRTEAWTRGGKGRGREGDGRTGYFVSISGKHLHRNLATWPWFISPSGDERPVCVHLACADKEPQSHSQPSKQLQQTPVRMCSACADGFMATFLSERKPFGNHDDGSLTSNAKSDSDWSAQSIASDMEDIASDNNFENDEDFGDIDDFVVDHMEVGKAGGRRYVSRGSSWMDPLHDDVDEEEDEEVRGMESRKRKRRGRGRASTHVAKSASEAKRTQGATYGLAASTERARIGQATSGKGKGRSGSGRKGTRHGQQWNSSGDEVSEGGCSSRDGSVELVDLSVESHSDGGGRADPATHSSHDDDSELHTHEPTKKKKGRCDWGEVQIYEKPIDQILAVKVKKPTTEMEMSTFAVGVMNGDQSDGALKDSDLECLVKLKGDSYRGVYWEDVDDVKQDTVGSLLLARHLKKNDIKGADFTLEEVVESEWMEVERIVAKRMEEVIDGGVTRWAPTYLVKWRGLNYSAATWEDDVEVEDELLLLAQHSEMEATVLLHKTALGAVGSGDMLDDGWGRAVAPVRLQEALLPLRDIELRDYQIDGVQWLLRQWQEGHSCILADDMGLGKTIECVAFLETIRRSWQHRIPCAHLVVAPLSTIDNWFKELARHTDAHVVSFQGTAADREMIKNNEITIVRCHERGRKGADILIPHFHVMITTYEMLKQEKAFFKSVRWGVVVVDEAHKCLKNIKSQTRSNLLEIAALHRVLLTGTPIQNNTQELFSLLQVVDAVSFSSAIDFHRDFGVVTAPEQVKLLKAILDKYMLRRTKEDVKLVLPTKTEKLVNVEMTLIQKSYYRAILERNWKFLARGSSKQHPRYNHVHTELRKVCMHPFLITGAREAICEEHMAKTKIDNLARESDEPATTSRDKVVDDPLVCSSGKLLLVHKLLPKLKADGSKVLIFSQFTMALDILEDYMVNYGYTFERLDGGVNAQKRNASVKRFNDPRSTSFAFLLSTRAGGVGLNLQAANVVILFDHDPNPQSDLQAIARSYRLGQQKAVDVFRLITRNTVEAEAFAQANKKLGLTQAVLHNSSKTMDANALDEILRRGAIQVLQEDAAAAQANFDKFLSEDIVNILSSQVQEIVVDPPVASVAQEEDKLMTFCSNITFKHSALDSQLNWDDPDFWQQVLPQESRIKSLVARVEELKLSLDDTAAAKSKATVAATRKGLIADILKIANEMSISQRHTNEIHDGRDEILHVLKLVVDSNICAGQTRDLASVRDLIASITNPKRLRSAVESYSEAEASRYKPKRNYVLDVVDVDDDDDDGGEAVDPLGEESSGGEGSGDSSAAVVERSNPGRGGGRGGGKGGEGPKGAGRGKARKRVIDTSADVDSSDSEAERANASKLQPTSSCEVDQSIPRAMLPNHLYARARAWSLVIGNIDQSTETFLEAVKAEWRALTSANKKWWEKCLGDVTTILFKRLLSATPFDLLGHCRELNEQWRRKTREASGKDAQSHIVTSEEIRAKVESWTSGLKATTAFLQLVKDQRRLVLDWSRKLFEIKMRKIKNVIGLLKDNESLKPEDVIPTTLVQLTKSLQSSSLPPFSSSSSLLPSVSKYVETLISELKRLDQIEVKVVAKQNVMETTTLLVCKVRPRNVSTLRWIRSNGKLCCSCTLSSSLDLYGLPLAFDCALVEAINGEPVTRPLTGAEISAKWGRGGGVPPLFQIALVFSSPEEAELYIAEAVAFYMGDSDVASKQVPPNNHQEQQQQQQQQQSLPSFAGKQPAQSEGVAGGSRLGGGLEKGDGVSASSRSENVEVLPVSVIFFYAKVVAPFILLKNPHQSSGEFKATVESTWARLSLQGIQWYTDWVRKIGNDVGKRLKRDGVFNVGASLELCSFTATKKMAEMQNIDMSSLGTLSTLVDEEKATQMIDQFRDREMEGRFKVQCYQNRQAATPLDVLPLDMLFSKKQERAEWLRRCLERGIDISDKVPLSLQSNTVYPHWPQWPSPISKDEFGNVARALEQRGWVKIIKGAPACELQARVEYIAPADIWRPVEALRTVLGAYSMRNGEQVWPSRGLLLTLRNVNVIKIDEVGVGKLTSGQFNEQCNKPGMHVIIASVRFNSIDDTAIFVKNALAFYMSPINMAQSSMEALGPHPQSLNAPPAHCGAAPSNPPSNPTSNPTSNPLPKFFMSQSSMVRAGPDGPTSPSCVPINAAQTDAQPTASSDSASLADPHVSLQPHNQSNASPISQSQATGSHPQALLANPYLEPDSPFFDPSYSQVNCAQLSSMPSLPQSLPHPFSSSPLPSLQCPGHHLPVAPASGELASGAVAPTSQCGNRAPPLTTPLHSLSRQTATPPAPALTTPLP